MPSAEPYLTFEELEAGLDKIRRAPASEGSLALIVRRPAVNQREVLPIGILDLAEGLIGDSWRQRGSSSTPDGSANPDLQINIMSVRAIALIARDESRWPLAGDQLYLDLDLSAANLPAGTRLAIGNAIVEVTLEPHLGCSKFAERFGPGALKFVNSPIGRDLRLRGLNARVVQPGEIRPGDHVRKLAA